MQVRSLFTVAGIAVLVGGWPGATPPAGAQGAFTFHATVTGKGRDSGTISAPEHATTVFDATGCAIVTQRAPAIFGASVFEVRYAGSNPVLESGLKPHGPYVLLEVDHFRLGVATYRTLDVAGSFAINGRTYGGGVSRTSVVQIRNGGRDGTWTEPRALRTYPGTTSGFSIHATWHCNRVFHLTEPKLSEPEGFTAR